MRAEDVVRDAIASRQTLFLVYRDGETRVVQPHVLYRSAKGSVLLDAYQVAGASMSGMLPGWREFDLALAPFGTAFQRAVWTALLAIPYGATISYLELARRIGNPSATRAVGRTNGLNPITIVVPCHRVIGADGTLTGYGGGLPRKEALLALEGARTLSQGRLPLAAR